MAMTRPEREVTYWMLERVLSYLRAELGSAGSLVAMQTTGTVSSMRVLGCAGGAGFREKGRGGGFGGEKGTGCCGGMSFVGVLRLREAQRRASLRSE
jgi:hypothetical protein